MARRRAIVKTHPEVRLVAAERGEVAGDRQPRLRLDVLDVARRTTRNRAPAVGAASARSRRTTPRRRWRRGEHVTEGASSCPLGHPTVIIVEATGLVTFRARSPRPLVSRRCRNEPASAADVCSDDRATCHQRSPGRRRPQVFSGLGFARCSAVETAPAVRFAALGVHDGAVAGWVTASTRSENFVASLADLVAQTPSGLDLHCVVDNLTSTPAVSPTPSPRRAVRPHRRAGDRGGRPGGWGCVG